MVIDYRLNRQWKIRRATLWNQTWGIQVLVFWMLCLIRNLWLQVRESTQLARGAGRKGSVSLGDKATREETGSMERGKMLSLSMVVHYYLAPSSPCFVHRWREGRKGRRKELKILVIKVRSGVPWRSLRSFQGFWEVKTLFTVILRREMPFTLMFALMMQK